MAETIPAYEVTIALDGPTLDFLERIAAFKRMKVEDVIADLVEKMTEMIRNSLKDTYLEE